jgi:ribose 5-phosphate isomerase B
MKSILIASDHAGFALKEKVKAYLGSKDFMVKDLGAYSKERCDYPLFAASLARLISRGKCKQGILICKSGIGNSIVANKFPGVRAALCYNVKAAALSRQHNDSNVLVLGSAFVNGPLAKKIISAWLIAVFEGGRHARRLKLIKEIEKEIGAGVK